MDQVVVHDHAEETPEMSEIAIETVQEFVEQNLKIPCMDDLKITELLVLELFFKGSNSVIDDDDEVAAARTHENLDVNIDGIYFAKVICYEVAENTDKERAGMLKSCLMQNNWNEIVADPEKPIKQCVEEQSAENIHGIIEAKDELVHEFPWMDFDVQNDKFSLILFQVNHHVLQLPLYIILHIPFACPHDERMENHSDLTECLGYVPYTHVGESNKRLKISYSCLQKRNQVLIVLHNSEFPKRDDLVSDRTALAGQLLKQSLTLDIVGVPKE